MAVDLCSYLEALETRRWGGLLEAWGWGLKWGMIQDVSGWWLTYPSEKYELVSWDDDIPNVWNTIKMFQTTILIPF